MSAVQVAQDRRDREIKALIARRELCQRSLDEFRPIPSYDPDGSVARAEQNRRTDLQNEIDRCEAEAAALERMSTDELVARLVPEVEAQRKAEALAAEDINLTDVLARGARR